MSSMDACGGQTCVGQQEEHAVDGLEKAKFNVFLVPSTL